MDGFRLKKHGDNVKRFAHHVFGHFHRTWVARGRDEAALHGLVLNALDRDKFKRVAATFVGMRIRQSFGAAAGTAGRRVTFFS